MHIPRHVFCVLVLALYPALVRAQLPSAPQPGRPEPFNGSAFANFSQSASATVSPSNAPLGNSASAATAISTKEQKKKPQTENGKQTNRILWVVPNFAAVSANANVAPLTPRQKFVLATKDSFDYSSFVWTGVIAAQNLAVNSDPEFGHGAAGYGRYYWHNFVDGVSGTYFTEAIVPVLTHEDPRYFTRGEGGFFHRLGYALSRTVLTRTDSGTTGFNWSEVGGNALEATLSNAYYPAQERGISQTAQNWGTQMESAALNNIVKEFWPDFRGKVLRQK